MKEELLNELKDAMKQKDELRKNTIMMIRAAILQVEKDTQKSLSDEEMISIFAKELKKRKESISDYQKGGREDIVETLNKEIEIIAKYLPQPLTEAEIESIVKNAIEEVGAQGPKDMGKVMQNIRPKTNGKADGKLVSDIVKKLLSNQE